MAGTVGAMVNVTVLRTIVAAAARRGVDARAFLAELGVAPELVASADGRVRSSVLHDAWRVAELRTNEPLFGLKASQTTALGDFDVLDYVCQSSRTLGDCYRHVERYIRILHEAAVIQVEEQGPQVRITYRAGSHPGGVLRHGAEYILAGLFLRGRLFTRVQWTPREVLFQHSAPADTAPHRLLFDCPVLFGRAENALVLDRALFDLPVPTADAALNAVLSRHAEELLGRVPPTSSMADQLRRLLPEALRTSDVSIGAIAAQLHITPRSLQRRLAEEQTSFVLLLDETRRDLALRYIGERHLAVGEMAFLLGFADASTFVRAFKRWTGETPTDYRRRGAA